jgi:16S rRNA (cytidine1402-2'-O)-methyltransferase
MTGTLFVVATPLGNLQDVTLRALEVLRGVAVIAAEDTRHSRKLLNHFQIRTPLVSYHDSVERRRAPRLVERLRRGEDVALISDAGTPGIADPGYRLVCAAIAAGLRVVPIPGACAVVAALSAAGLPVDRFCFEGFVPARPSERRSFYLGVRSERRTVVCFETARRLTASLADLEEALGARRIVVARELTKTFEEFLRGPVDEVRRRVDGGVRGEVTLVIEPAREPELASEAEVRASVARLRARGMGLKETARAVSRDSGWPMRDVYRLGLENEEREGGEPGLS